MRKTLTNLWRGTLDLLVPPVCWLCDASPADDAPLCPDCHGLLTEDSQPVCPRCASTLAAAAAAENVCPRCLKESFAFDSVVRFGPYDGVHRDLVLRFKHERGEVLAEALAPIFAGQLAPKLRRHNPQIAIPIPLHWRRRWSRGYNQSEVLARAVAQTLQIEFKRDALRRIKNTPFQSTVSIADRKANVRGAFAAKAGCDLSGRTVILVDDVLTTGATASEAARVLRKCGATQIIVAVFAHDSAHPARGGLRKNQPIASRENVAFR